MWSPRVRIVGVLAIAVMSQAGIGCSPIPPPIVDMQGVDQVKYNRDLADCYKYAGGVIEFGNPVTNCMEKRGYKILYRS